MRGSNTQGGRHRRIPSLFIGRLKEADTEVGSQSFSLRRMVRGYDKLALSRLKYRGN